MDSIAIVETGENTANSLLPSGIICRFQVHLETNGRRNSSASLVVGPTLQNRGEGADLGVGTAHSGNIMETNREWGNEANEAVRNLVSF